MFTGSSLVGSTCKTRILPWVREPRQISCYCLYPSSLPGPTFAKWSPLPASPLVPSSCGEDQGQVGVGKGSNWTRTSEAKKNSLVVQTESCLVRILAFHGLYKPSWTIGPSAGLDRPGRPQFPFLSLETSGEPDGGSTRKVIPWGSLVPGGGEGWAGT